LLILFATVGIYRWSRILTGRTAIATWRADEQQGSEWYRRAMRARARVALIYVHVEPGTVEGKAGAQAADRTPGDRNLQPPVLR